MTEEADEDLEDEVDLEEEQDEAARERATSKRGRRRLRTIVGGEELVVEMIETADVLAEYVELKIHDRADSDMAEVGVVMSERDDADGERVVVAIDDSETDAIDSNRALFDSEIAQKGALAVEVIVESVDPAAIGLLEVGASGSAVDMALDDMTV